MTYYGFVASGFEISLNISSRAASPAHCIAAQASRQTSPRNTRFTALRPSILVTGHAGTICSLDDFTCRQDDPIGRRALAPWLLRTPKASNMAKLNPGSVAAIVLAGSWC